MNWLTKIADEIEQHHPDGELLVSSGVSPSGTYHLGTLREVLTAEAIMRELKNRGRDSRHVHVVDDLDVFRKVPADVPSDFEKYLGMPLCDVPAPDGSDGSYADFFLKDLLEAGKKLQLGMEIMRAHQKYREGFFVPAIERSLEQIKEIRSVLEEVSGRKLDEQWTPIQVVEEGYLKNRPFVSIDTDKKTIVYLDKDKQDQTASYANGEVKLNWRIDWPARWSLLGVKAEPFGRDHATKGGSYDTGSVLAKKVFEIEPPLPVPYEFINRTGDTKKMSKSAGNTLTAIELLNVLPPEVVWFFIIRYAPNKTLFFDTGETLMRLFDEFAELQAKADKSEDESYLLNFCLQGVDEPTVSNIPFSHLIASYQAARRDVDKTLEVISRTEHKETVDKQREIIKRELTFISSWLEKYAPEEVKFSIEEQIDTSQFTDQQKQFLSKLAEKIQNVPEDADGEWFHKAIYDLKDESGMEPKDMFSTLYRALINKSAGPRAGWFLASFEDRDWLIKRLRLEV
ncbi:MAG TPA: lysine--tRNA ligase [Candidatus Saccharimonadales bacterium]|nr:lysine--tRNA ligase [Candidatus Saccharimonadales bacterium]